ncbi:MAG: lysylphosphatidylglycerol synthase transmembrane domain-containing protein [Sulfurimonas sp.]|nr:lysylphosphatidylglycerol synthase transmembrane domain-containing protein [Sulfurimonas sp.]MDD3059699.1 lysylphosphatidylglycerol synthase transmembrane domain-containing protein [Sulfurimonas sp.]MDD5201908.1 lysylphosphatidylglycerol synthase transmembrane domain-containing protein [Sulfurimonas sp.]
MKSKVIQILFLLLIVFYIIHDFNVEKINLSIVSWCGVMLTSFVVFLGQLALSLRWMKMSKISFKISYETITVSTALNMILPAKLGELSKALYMKKFYKYSFHRGISLVFVERFFDIIILFLLMCFWAYLYFSSPAIKNGIIGLSILIIFIIIFFKSRRILLFLKKIPFRFLRIYSQKIYNNVNKILREPFSVFSLTLLVWLIYFLASFVFFSYAVNFGLNFENILELFIFSTIAFAIPLTPAGVGTFQAVVMLFLENHGVGKEDAFVSATIYHIVMFAVYFLLLVIFLYKKDMKLKDIIKIKS